MAASGHKISHTDVRRDYDSLVSILNSTIIHLDPDPD